MVEAMFLPDGNTLVSHASHDKEIMIWDAVTGQPRYTLVHPENIMVLALSVDATKLAAGLSNGCVWVWNVNIGQVDYQLKGQ